MFETAATNFVFLRGEEGSSSEQGGFSLLELMVAVAILAVAITGVVAALMEAGRLEENTRERRTSRNAVDRQIASLEALDRGNFGQEMIDYIEGQNGFDRHAEFEVENLEPAPGETTVGSITYDDTDVMTDNILVVTVRTRWDGVMGEQNLHVTRYFYVHS